MVGVFDQIRGRKTEQITANTFAAVEDEKSISHDGSDSDTLSLEARNEKEVQQHPDQVTADAQQGIQKAEAAALVWTKPALYCTFAW